MLERFWPAGILALITGLVYLNSFPGAFHYDDYPLMLENSLVREYPFRWSAFLEHYGGRPLTLWTLHWNYRLGGESPLGYHLVNLMIHILATAGVYWTGLRLARWLGNPGRERTFAFAAAFLFALHPIQTQAVNYIWSRSVLLMVVFGLASVLVLERRPWLSVIFFQLAVWSRTEGLVLVPLLLLLAPPLWKPLLPLAVLNLGGFLYSVIRYAPQEIGWSYPDLLGFWLAQPQAFVKYLDLWLRPGGLSIDHDFQPASWIVSMLLLAAAAAAAVGLWRIRRRHPIPACAALVMVAAFLPAALVPNPDLINEGRFYSATVGASLLVAWLLIPVGELARGLRPAGFRLRPQGVTVAALLLAAVWLAPVTLERNRIWQDDRRLWEDAAMKYPNKGRIQYNLGVAWVDRGDLAAAEQAFSRAVDLNPQDDMSYAALGYCWERLGEKSSALDLYRLALELNQDNDYARAGVQRLIAAGGLAH